MRIRLLMVLLSLATCLTAFPTSAGAVDLSLGAKLGYAFDLDEDFLLFGGEARIGLEKLPFTLNPAVAFHPGELEDLLQIDVNALRYLELANKGRFHPYYGAGLAFQRLSFDNGDEIFTREDESKVGLNFLGGVEMDLGAGSFHPFAHFQYTAANDGFNSFVLFGGVSFRISGSDE